MNLHNIEKMPTIIEKNHESLFRSYHVLNLVRKMLKRGDSKETILGIIDLLYSKEEPITEKYNHMKATKKQKLQIQITGTQGYGKTKIQRLIEQALRNDGYNVSNEKESTIFEDEFHIGAINLIQE